MPNLHPTPTMSSATPLAAMIPVKRLLPPANDYGEVIVIDDLEDDEEAE